MTERIQGRIVNVWTTPAATTLNASAAIGATVLSVDDASIFNDDGDGGSLLVGTQVTTYTTVDDDAGTVTIPAPGLTVAADVDDSVTVWSELYGLEDSRQWASVEPAGKGDRADHIEAVVRDSLELVDGDRGKRGEACTLVRESGSDTWTVKGIHGRPRKARGLKAEANDAYTLTTNDVARGYATIPLSHSPIEESLKLTFGTVPQEPSNYTVNYDAKTITFPLEGWETAGLRISTHYWYQQGPVKPPISCAGGAIPDPTPSVSAPYWGIIPGFGSSAAYLRDVVFSVDTPAGGVVGTWLTYAIIAPAPTDATSDAGSWRGNSDIDPASWVNLGYDSDQSAWITSVAGQTVSGTLTVSVSNYQFSGNPEPTGWLKGDVVGVGYILNAPGSWNALPQDNAAGLIGVTDLDNCRFYWGPKIAETTDDRDEPLGPLRVGS